MQAVILGVGMTAAMLTVAKNSGTAGDLVRLSTLPLIVRKCQPDRYTGKTYSGHSRL